MDCKELNPDVILVVTTIHCGEAPAVKTVTNVREFMGIFGDDMIQTAEENFFEISNGWFKGYVWCTTKYRDMRIVRCNSLEAVIEELARPVDCEDFDYIDGYEHGEQNDPVPMVYDSF